MTTDLIIDLEYQFRISCCTRSSKHNGMDYNNLFEIGIPDLLLNMLSCHLFLNNNDSVVILKCPNRIYEYYLIKDSLN